MAAARHNEAQRGTTAARHNRTLIFTAGLQRGEGVASMFRQRGTVPTFAHFFFTERWDQSKRSTTARPKLDTMTGAHNEATPYRSRKCHDRKWHNCKCNDRKCRDILRHTVHQHKTECFTKLELVICCSFRNQHVVIFKPTNAPYIRNFKY